MKSDLNHYDSIQDLLEDLGYLHGDAGIGNYFVRLEDGKTIPFSAIAGRSVREFVQRWKAGGYLEPLPSKEVLRQKGILNQPLGANPILPIGGVGYPLTIPPNTSTDDYLSPAPRGVIRQLLGEWVRFNLQVQEREEEITEEGSAKLESPFTERPWRGMGAVAPGSKLHIKRDGGERTEKESTNFSTLRRQFDVWGNSKAGAGD